MVGLNGRARPSRTRSRRGDFRVEDERKFSGVYAQAEWIPTPRLRVQLGARLNHTARTARRSRTGGERRRGRRRARRRTHRPRERERGRRATAWRAEARRRLACTAMRAHLQAGGHRLGPEAEAEILEPETARSYEMGLKGRSSAAASAGRPALPHGLREPVVSQVVNGLPALVNGGSERFKGFELDSAPRRARPRLARYAFHDARSRLPHRVRRRADAAARKAPRDGSRHLGLGPAPLPPDPGFIGLGRREKSSATASSTSATPRSRPSTRRSGPGLGYRADAGSARRRQQPDRQAAGDLGERVGDAQYYRLPARSVRLSLLLERF